MCKDRFNRTLRGLGGRYQNSCQDEHIGCPGFYVLCISVSEVELGGIHEPETPGVKSRIMVVVR